MAIAIAIASWDDAYSSGSHGQLQVYAGFSWLEQAREKAGWAADGVEFTKAGVSWVFPVEVL